MGHRHATGRREEHRHTVRDPHRENQPNLGGPLPIGLGQGVQGSTGHPGLDHLDAAQPGLESDPGGQATDDAREDGEDLERRRRKTAARSCRKLTRQIEHYQGVVQLARERDDELWESRMQQHVDRLVVRRAARCPEYQVDDQTWERIKEFLYLGGKIALKVFTFGLF